MPSPELNVALLSQGYYDLQRQGSIDQQRHSDKVKEAIKGNLPEIISEESIINADEKKVIKVPIRGLELPHFRFDPKDPRGTRTGEGKGDSKPGDIVAR